MDCGWIGDLVGMPGNGRWVLREIPNPRGGLQSGSIEFLTGLRAFGSALLPDVGLVVVLVVLFCCFFGH